MVSVNGNHSDNLILKMRQLRDSWKNTIHGDDRFSLLGFYKMSDYWVYDLKSCRSQNLGLGTINS